MRPDNDPEAFATEEAPLLNADHQLNDGPDEPISSNPRFKASRWQVKSPRAIVFLLAFIKFCAVCSGMMMLIPLYRLIEDALCHVYYEDDSPGLIEEMKCKTDEVQSRLAYLLGWLGLTTAIMTLIVAFPYGMLADRIGRKPTALLAYGGIALSFAFSPIMLGTYNYMIRDNPYILMGGAFFMLIGGGVPVMLATLYAMAADVSSEQDKAASFLYLTFGATAGGLIGPLLTGLLMHISPWVPIYTVLAITPPVFCIFFLIPETLAVNVKAQRTEYEAPAEAFKTHIISGLKDLASSVKILRNKNVPLVLVTFLVQNARFAAYTSLLAQYISKHFGWKLAETSLLLSPLGVLNLILLVALPKISQILMSPRYGFTSFGKDLFLTRTSTLLIVVGAVIEWLSHNVVLFIFGLFISTLGAADSPLARATVSHYVEPEYTSRLYALIGMTEVLGSFIGGPVLAYFFDIGMHDNGGIWMGLPWLYIGLLCSGAWLALVFVSPPSEKPEPEEAFPCEGHRSD